MTRSLAFLLFCVLPAAAQPSLELDRKLSATIADALKASGAPSVSVAVVQNGKMVYARAFGTAEVAKSRAADEATRYAIGSVSKQFTAAALLLLEEQGKLSLDDKVSKYFPALTRGADITIRQLLSHTSGYEDYAPQDYMIPEWSRPNFVLAAEIFEKVSGQPLLDFLAKRIFQPLGMSTAGDCLAARPSDAVAYTRYAAGPPRLVDREASGWYFGAGELCMTPSDLARWDIAFLEKKILSARSYAEFTREAKLANGDSSHYALGLQLGELRGIPMIFHGGEVSGFLASNSVFPNRDGAVIVLSNEDGVDLVGPVSRQVAELVFLPDRPQAPEREIAQVRSILEGLSQGKIDSELFTANARAYFGETALADYRASLTALGGLKSVSRLNESLRGGMIHRSYRAEYEKKTVSLNIYVMPDGKYEQFLVVAQ
jgi:CubicO group peptidase (beta-lactamase class C family)